MIFVKHIVFQGGKILDRDGDPWPPALNLTGTGTFFPRGGNGAGSRIATGVGSGWGGQIHPVEIRG
jgi:hypothetical protein